VSKFFLFFLCSSGLLCSSFSSERTRKLKKKITLFWVQRLSSPFFRLSLSVSSPTASHLSLSHLNAMAPTAASPSKHSSSKDGAK